MEMYLAVWDSPRLFHVTKNHNFVPNGVNLYSRMVRDRKIHDTSMNSIVRYSARSCNLRSFDISFSSSVLLGSYKL